MFSIKDIPFTLLALLFSLQLIAAVPTWEGMNGRSSMGSLIPGASYIEAKGPVSSGSSTRHLSVHRAGELGNLSIISNTYEPPYFYISQNQLWLLVNETTVYPVNVHNSTGIHELPMQLILGKKKEGIVQGTWRWKATSLYYDFPGGKSNNGLYFRCLLESGAFNVFMSIIPQPPPQNCQMMTLHSFIRNHMK
ncbi:hypothetical protein CVT25_011209 [Psilocybe cyanescens]|uniref:Uncharacterized protein n=1 Tax=Psilocybe cyanescens TaxID=93625 RepID=A0A409WGW7_PSICY|nr:hypothetical protein CVT25_011209 [Psilocybe cyanescens]